MYRLISILFVMAIVSLSSPQAFAQTKAGMLVCNTSATIGWIVGSQQKISCTFTPEYNRVPENYFGTIGRIGLDIGVTAAGVMSWLVIAPTDGGLMRGALAGDYVGASADISLGLGVGANVLVGGSNRSVALQPLSVEGEIGINLAIGVAGLTLREAY